MGMVKEFKMEQYLMNDLIKSEETEELINKFKQTYNELNSLKTHMVQAIIRLDERVPVDTMNRFAEMLKKPLEIDDKRVLYAVEMFKSEVEKLANMDVGKVTNELKFIAKRIHEVDQRLQSIETNGIPSHAQISVTLDGSKMMKVPHNFDSVDEKAQKMDVEKDPSLDKLMSLLDENEKKVISMRLGLYGHKIHSYKEISDIIGISYADTRKAFQVACIVWERKENRSLLKKVSHPNVVILRRNV